MKRHRLAALIVAGLLAGCASNYEQFYRPVSLVNVAGSAPVTEEPKVVGSSGDPKTDVNAMYAAGYGLVGMSSFDGPNEGVAGAIKQAKKVGATRVVVSQKYARTVSGSIPITMPTSSTTYTSGTASAYGSGGSAYGNYNGTSTTYGTRTTYMPFSVDRYDQTALYFVPLERKGLGVLVSRLSPEEVSEIGSNKGAEVSAVRRGSPAFMADVLPGDILRSINGTPIIEAESLSVISTLYGTTAKLVVWRKERNIEIDVPLSGDGRW